MKFLVGTGKEDQTCFIPGLGMMGYGQEHNRVKEIATPLWARALFFRDESDHNFIMVHLEQAFVTLAIKEEVLKRLNLTHASWKITDANLAITAQHTHSAPGGYSHYPFYNLTIPNFQTRVFEKVVSSIIAAIESAEKSLKSATLHFGHHIIPDEVEVAFNRSMTAHALNPEAQHSTEKEKNLAVDRATEGLWIHDENQNLMGFVNWFGVHGTSISSFNQRIHHDNKGVAADLFEKQHPGSVALFLQASAGDVSPNFIWDKSTKLMRGKYKDHYENAAYNGELQANHASQIPRNDSVARRFESHHLFLDMAQVVAAPAHGVGFFLGTLEGPGAPAIVGTIAKGVSRLVKKFRLMTNPELHEEFYKAHGNKDVLLDHRNGSFIGLPLSFWKKLPPLPDPAVEAFRKTAKKDALETLPWIPSILPFQLLRLGHLAIAFVPGEISVMGGRRLKLHLLRELAGVGVSKILIASYANAYMGYIVTPEEYDQQCYEGGHCVYGRETLTGIIQGFHYLAQKLKGGEIPKNLPSAPFHFPADELARRST